MTQGWEIKERLDHLVDAVIDSRSAAWSRRRSSTSPTAMPRSSGAEPGTQHSSSR